MDEVVGGPLMARVFAGWSERSRRLEFDGGEVGQNDAREGGGFG